MISVIHKVIRLLAILVDNIANLIHFNEQPPLLSPDWDTNRTKSLRYYIQLPIGCMHLGMRFVFIRGRALKTYVEERTEMRGKTSVACVIFQHSQNSLIFHCAEC